mmetsp:Transcript_34590/g.90584  ORF Transcript_34590/g.90584 Transcript_34590/m.90584 type:complete len:273 (+) Transcript_34590:119-937(+)
MPGPKGGNGTGGQRVERDMDGAAVAALRECYTASAPAGCRLLSDKDLRRATQQRLGVVHDRSVGLIVLRPSGPSPDEAEASSDDPTRRASEGPRGDNGAAGPAAAPPKLAASHVLMLEVKHGKWAFPKGHPDHGESDVDAARRETEEEAGVVVPTDTIDESSFMESAYSVIKKRHPDNHTRAVHPRGSLPNEKDLLVTHKTVRYYAAMVSGDLERGPAEALSVAWVPVKEVAGRLPHFTDRAHFEAFRKRGFRGAGDAARPAMAAAAAGAAP